MPRPPIKKLLQRVYLVVRPPNGGSRKLSLRPDWAERASDLTGGHDEAQRSTRTYRTTAGSTSNFQNFSGLK